MRQTDPRGKTVCRRDSGTRAYRDVCMACLPTGIGLPQVKYLIVFLHGYFMICNEMRLRTKDNILVL
jgi:hypothetical protein